MLMAKFPTFLRSPIRRGSRGFSIMGLSFVWRAVHFDLIRNTLIAFSSELFLVVLALSLANGGPHFKDYTPALLPSNGDKSLSFFSFAQAVVCAVSKWLSDVNVGTYIVHLNYPVVPSHTLFFEIISLCTRQKEQ